jgi:hypothetical protein
VNWYWETDYDVYVNNGNSIANVTTWIQGLFNQVATLYANDGITVNLKTLKVWTVADPYTGPATNDYFNQFTNSGPQSFDGDFATLIGYGNGGMAWMNEYCDIAKYKKCYCGINTSYNSVPVWSWSVDCVTHENGHLLGSPHTHACRWNGNNTAIDGCYATEGGCASPGLPTGGGTIMSYCQLTGVGVNFTLGFGPQPKALITNYLNAATCLQSCGTQCVVPAQPGTISGASSACPSSTQKYAVAAVSGATSYSWVLPSGWTGTSTNDSISATAGSSGGTISVTAFNSCGNSVAQTLNVSVSGATPLQPGTITGNISPCTNSSQTYSIAAVSGATSYTWVLPSGWTGTSVTTSITTTAGTGSGTISVKANNSCGSSAAQTLAVSISGAAPLQPGAISGNNVMCKSTSQTYSVVAVSGATSYKWTLPSGWSGSSTTNTITATAGASGTISVTAVNSCGSSNARTLSVTVNAIPAQPGTMNGNSPICKNTSQTYSVPVVSGASSYAWTLPSGWTGSSTTNSITVAVGTTGGTISVKAVNNCGISAARSKSVSITQPPGQPGTISGNASVCAGSSQKYSASASGATSYTWTLPTGWTGTSTTSSIVTTVGASGGVISVIGHNICGSSPLPSTKSLSINTIPATPGAISGNIVVLAATKQLYSVSPVTGATSYTWKLPSGWSGSSTSYSITATSGSAGGTISVSANNTCGKSALQTLDVRVDTGYLLELQIPKTGCLTRQIKKPFKRV